VNKKIYKKNSLTIFMEVSITKENRRERQIIKSLLFQGPLLGNPKNTNGPRVNHVYMIFECSGGKFSRLLEEDFKDKVIEYEKEHYGISYHLSRKRREVEETIEKIKNSGKEEFDREYKVYREIKESQKRQLVKLMKLRGLM
jgi:hypothetical protein